MYKGPYQREEKPSEDDKRFALEHIALAIQDWDWTRSTAMAYCDQIYQTLLVNRGWRVDKPETLHPFIERANLPMDKELNDALSEAWGRSSYARCISYDEMVLNTVHVEGYIDACDSNLLLAIIERCGKTGDWMPNARGAAQIAQDDEAAQRARLIASITQGRDTFQVYGGRPGEAKRLMELQSSELNNLDVTIEKLRELDTAAADVRRKREGTRDENRAELQQRADQARGTKIFRPGNKTELDGTVRFKNETKGRNAYEFADGGPNSKPTAGVTMDRSAAIVNPASDSLFTSPVSGVQYSKKEVYQLAGGSEADRKLFRKMMNTDLARLNSILAGN